jgi:hypothetical protein
MVSGSSEMSGSPLLSEAPSLGLPVEEPLSEKQANLRMEDLSLRDDSASPSQGSTPGPQWLPKAPPSLEAASFGQPPVGDRSAAPPAPERRGSRLLSGLLSPSRTRDDSPVAQDARKENEQLPR